MLAGTGAGEVVQVAAGPRQARAVARVEAGRAQHLWLRARRQLVLQLEPQVGQAAVEAA